MSRMYIAYGIIVIDMLLYLYTCNGGMFMCVCVWYADNERFVWKPIVFINFVVDNRKFVCVCCADWRLLTILINYPILFVISAGWKLNPVDRRVYGESVTRDELCVFFESLAYFSRLWENFNSSEHSMHPEKKLDYKCFLLDSKNHYITFLVLL